MRLRGDKKFAAVLTGTMVLVLLVAAATFRTPGDVRGQSEAVSSTPLPERAQAAGRSGSQSGPDFRLTSVSACCSARASKQGTGPEESESRTVQSPVDAETIGQVTNGTVGSSV